MSEPHTNRPDTSGAADEPVIEAVGYTPVSESRERSLPLSPLQIGLVLVAIPIIAVLWFLFTARSVSLERSAHGIR